MLGNWFLGGLLRFSRNSFIRWECLLLNVTLATELQSQKKKKSLYVTIIKFGCSPSFDLIEFFNS